jgi:hypothetical protein
LDALAYVRDGIGQSGTVAWNEYLLAEDLILRPHLPSRRRLTDPQRRTLAEIAKRVGGKVMKDIAQVAQPDTILGWYRRLVAAEFDGSAGRTYPCRPRISAEVEAWWCALRGKTAAGATTGSWVH